MIRNILFDMGNVLIYFDRNLFMERLGVAEEDKKLLMREVTVKKVFIGDTPRLMEASSTKGSIWYRKAVPDRTV